MAHSITPADTDQRKLQGYIDRADIEVSRLTDQIRALEAKRRDWYELGHAARAKIDELADPDCWDTEIVDQDLLDALESCGLPTASESTVPAGAM